MQLTRQADYAVRAVLYLAEHPPEKRVTTAEIGREQRIPVTFLTKIMAQLVTAGVVQTTRGARGGVMLSRSPDTITMLEVIEAIEGPMRLNTCVPEVENCPMGNDCRVQHVWAAAQDDLVKRLQATTFSGLARPPAGVTGGPSTTALTALAF
jgi:Rrf2 family protein